MDVTASAWVIHEPRRLMCEWWRPSSSDETDIAEAGSACTGRWRLGKGANHLPLTGQDLRYSRFSRLTSDARQYVIAMRSFTSLTPGAAQAALSASSRSAQEWTLPLSVTLPPSACTLI